ncbi:MAG: thiamine pyrophosphate-dependent enzyme, partial [Candidatus Aenigmatarchaeota archaeon]
MANQLLSPGHSMCSGCGVAIALNQISRTCPENLIISCATSCAEVCTSIYPHTAWERPWIHAAFETTSSVASGIEAAVKKLGKDWKVLALAGDGGTFDIGLQALSGMLERGHKVTQVCLDNECYANCLSLSTLIMTEDGLKKITEIKEGDRIYAFDQKAHQPVLKRCTGVFDNGEQKVYELGTLHHSIKATSNHPFLVLKRNGRGRQNHFVWKTLSNVKVGDEIVALKHLDTSSSHRFRPIKVSKKGDYKVNKINGIRLPRKSSPDLMEYLGIYVGDGWCRVKKCETGFALPEGTKERKRLIQLHSRIFKSGVSREEDNYVYINSVNLARFIDSLGFGYGSKNKTIPGWVFTLPKKEKEAFVKGLILSDGYKIGSSFRYVSSSHDLLKRLRLLLQTMGYRVGKIHWRKTKKSTWVVYRKLLKDTESGYVCFCSSRKWNVEKYPNQYKYKNFLIKNKHFEMEKVKHKKLIKTEPTLDLRVEGEHNFIADGIVVHNTGVQRSGATPYGAWTTTSPPGKVSKGKTEWKKPIVDIVAAHRIPYTASASVAYPNDLVQKMKKAFELQPSFVHIHCPCPTGWKFGSPET